MSILKLAVVGAGQIGTSFVTASALAHPELEIVAVDKKASVQDKFHQALNDAGGAHDNVLFTTDISQIRDADLICIAVPLGQYESVARAIRPFLKPDAIVMDVGSAKESPIEDLVKVLPDGTELVPGHIFNGNAGMGPETSDPSIFKKKTFFLVPGHASTAAMAQVQEFVQSLGSIPKLIDAERHDKIQATLSGNEHVAVFSLMASAFMQEAINQRGLPDPGNWIQGFTRVGNAGPDMWTDIFIANRDKILDSAKHFRGYLAEIAQELQRYPDRLKSKIDAAHDYAENMPSARMQKIDLNAAHGEDLHLSAFAGLVSLAITKNIQRMEDQISEPVEPIVNPSAKDGMGAIAHDPDSAFALSQEYAPALVPMMREYLFQVDTLITHLENRDKRSLRETVARVNADHQHLKLAFADAPAIAVPAANLTLSR